MWDLLQAGRARGAGSQPPAVGRALISTTPYLIQSRSFPSARILGVQCGWLLTPCSGLFSRHPVRHVWFNSHSLITANIPEEKNPRGSSITEDDPSVHRK